MFNIHGMTLSVTHLQTYDDHISLWTFLNNLQKILKQGKLRDAEMFKYISKTFKSMTSLTFKYKQYNLTI